MSSNLKKCSVMMKGLLYLVGASVISTANAQTYDVKMETSIRGSSEQPQVLFILPWQDDLVARVPSQQAPLLEQEYRQPVNYDQIQREKKWHQPRSQ